MFCKNLRRRHFQHDSEELRKSVLNKLIKNGDKAAQQRTLSFEQQLANLKFNTENADKCSRSQSSEPPRPPLADNNNTSKSTQTGVVDFDLSKFKAYLNSFESNMAGSRSCSMPPIQNDLNNNMNTKSNHNNCSYNSPLSNRSHAKAHANFVDIYNSYGSYLRGGGGETARNESERPNHLGFLDYSSLLHYPVPTQSSSNKSNYSNYESHSTCNNCKKLSKIIETMPTTPKQHQQQQQPIRSSMASKRDVWAQRTEQNVRTALNSPMRLNKTNSFYVAEPTKTKSKDDPSSFSCGLLSKFKLGNYSNSKSNTSNMMPENQWLFNNEKRMTNLKPINNNNGSSNNGSRTYEKFFDFSEDAYMPRTMLNLSSSSPSLVSFMSDECSSDTCSESSLSSFLNETLKHHDTLNKLKPFDYDEKSFSEQPDQAKCLNSAFSRPACEPTQVGRGNNSHNEQGKWMPMACKYIEDEEEFEIGGAGCGDGDSGTKSHQPKASTNHLDREKDENDYYYYRGANPLNTSSSQQPTPQHQHNRLNSQPNETLKKMQQRRVIFVDQC